MAPHPPTPVSRGPLPRRKPHGGSSRGGQQGSSGPGQKLRQASQETLKILPALLNKLGTTKHAKTSYKYTLKEVTRLNPQYCPKFPQPATIHVVNDDTTNAGLTQAATALPAGTTVSELHDWNPVIVNFANEHVPGGGWLQGALAQEETIFYRTSLSLSLSRKQQYPLAAGAVYTPYVLVVRGDIASGHRLLDASAPQDLPVLGAVTVAAIRRPAIRTFDVHGPAGPGAGTPGKKKKKQVFALDSERNTTKDKMRLVLRMAAYNRHRRLVLGALGCGVYGNPAEDVAQCWLEVLREGEFAGNWWADVCFAVYDPKKTGNFEAFRRVLDGRTV